MIRPRIRLGTLALLILIAALICAQVVQWQREDALRVRLEFEKARAREEAAVARAQAMRTEAALRQAQAAKRARPVQPPPNP